MVLLSTVESCLVATPLIQCMATLLLRPLYSGGNKSSASHFSYLKNPFNMTTLLTQADFCDPLVTGLMGFHCTCSFYECVCTIPSRDAHPYLLLTYFVFIHLFRDIF